MRGTILTTWLVVVAALPAMAQIRTELPIRDVALDSGSHLYSVPVTLGGTRIEAGLDTGSTGLRILPGTLADGDAQDGGPTRDYSFTSGVRYEGDSARGVLALGTLSGPVTLETIAALTCRKDKPRCPALTMTRADYGVRGNSLTAGRFRAILGVNSASADIDNPLLALGVKRWIVELPRPGETGKLILNPGDAELAGFARLPTITNLGAQGGLKDSVQGCLVDGETKARDCGALVLDSGAPNIRLVHGKLDGMNDGAPAALAFYDADGVRAIANFTIGNPAMGTRLRADSDGRLSFTAIFAGTAPYLAFDVLYDGAEIGLRPRPAAAGIPTGQMVPKG
jgi:hypothetical protein